jgi:hypothetical protein
MFAGLPLAGEGIKGGILGPNQYSLEEPWLDTELERMH